jgi:YYY domain-containing protein
VSPELQILWVISWIAVIKFLQMAVWPLLHPVFSRCAYGVSYPVSLLIFTVLSWYCGIAGLPLLLALVPFVILAVNGVRTGFYRMDAIAEYWAWDLLFFLSFAFLLEVRFLNPSISFAEKLMDHAFLASIMRTPTVPPLDPWFAGGTLNVYYYMGYWMMGALGLVSGVPSPVVFNLVLPTVLGNAAVSLYALGHILMQRFRWLPVLTLFIVNPSFVAHALSGEPISTIMWESTRTITDTITEFPLFSLLWGDIHAHVIDIFNQACYLFILVFALVEWHTLSGRAKWLLVAAAAVSLGSMPVINSWDVLIYAPLTLLVGAAIWWQRRNSGEAAPWRFLLATPPLAIALYLPYYLQLESAGVSGIGIVSTPSDPVQFLLVYGFFIATYLIFLWRDIVRRPYLLLVAVPFVLAGFTAAALAAVPLVYFAARRSWTPVTLLAMAGLAAILLTELIYLMDNMGEAYYRMNTVFKFSLAAWIMMGPSTFAIIGTWLERVPRVRDIDGDKARRIAIVVILALLIIPFLLPDLSYGYGGRGLDGLSYLDTRHPGDADAIRFLRSLEGDIRIVEAEGGDYKYYSRVSSFTGIPTVIGMPFHEIMWRGTESGVGRRTADVRDMYQDPDQTLALIDQYGIDLIYVGEMERERYTVALPSSGLELIYDQKDVQIYRRVQ